MSTHANLLSRLCLLQWRIVTIMPGIDSQVTPGLKAMSLGVLGMVAGCVIAIYLQAVGIPIMVISWLVIIGGWFFHQTELKRRSKAR